MNASDESPRESWLTAPPASPSALDALRQAVGGLPISYLSLLSRGNGGELNLDSLPFCVCIDSAERALDYWSSGAYTIRDAFIFGGDGGGTLFALDLKSTPSPVIAFDPIDPEDSSEIIAPAFEYFLALLADAQSSPSAPISSLNRPR